MYLSLITISIIILLFFFNFTFIMQSNLKKIDKFSEWDKVKKFNFEINEKIKKKNEIFFYFFYFN